MILNNFVNYISKPPPFSRSPFDFAQGALLYTWAKS